MVKLEMKGEVKAKVKMKVKVKVKVHFGNMEVRTIECPIAVAGRCR
jgi:hypothetical protein